MRLLVKFLSVACLILVISSATAIDQSPVRAASSSGRWDSLRTTIDRYLGLPYVWGSTGMKSFDCSGFVWRVLADNGIFMKRTTARKLYMMLPAVEKSEMYTPGYLVFFDDLKHVGFVGNQMQFYHAATTKGTTLAYFDPYWRSKIYGFRKIKTDR